MSIEAQAPSEKPAPGPRPHRCNARVEDLLQVSVVLLKQSWRCSVVSWGIMGHPAIVRLSALLSTPPFCPLQALFTLEFGAKVRPAWRNVRECLKSEPGYVYHAYAKCMQPPLLTAPPSCTRCHCRHEPSQAYLCVKDPDLYLNPARMTYKR